MVEDPQDHLAWVMGAYLDPGEPFLDNNCSNIYSLNAPALQLEIWIQPLLSLKKNCCYWENNGKQGVRVLTANKI